MPIPGQPEKQTVAAGFRVLPGGELSGKAVGVCLGGPCRPSVLRGDLERLERSTEETAAHAGLADDFPDPLPHFAILLSLPALLLLAGPLGPLALGLGHGLRAGAGHRAHGAPEHSAGHHEALRVAGSPAKLTCDRGGRIQPLHAWVVAQEHPGELGLSRLHRLRQSGILRASGLRPPRPAGHWRLAVQNIR